jgi:hypothetical protein
MGIEHAAQDEAQTLGLYGLGRKAPGGTQDAGMRLRVSGCCSLDDLAWTILSSSAAKGERPLPSVGLRLYIVAGIVAPRYAPRWTLAYNSPSLRSRSAS